MKRCARCVLPESYPKIDFDENGVCRVCREYDAKWKGYDFKKSEERLLEIFEKNKRLSKNKKYDCIVPLSGGRDSTYVLYLCVVKYNLRVLGVTFENWFQSEEGRLSIQNAIKKLGVGYVTFRPRWELIRSLYSLCLQKTGEFCAPCNIGLNSTTWKVAKQEDIHLAIFGISPRTDEDSPKEVTCTRVSVLRNVIKGEMPLKEIDDFLWERPTTILHRVKNKLLGRGWPNIDLPAYIEWNIEEIKKILKRELDWQQGDRPDHTDCIMEPVKDYLRRLKWGFNHLTQKYSALIRDGQMSREEALRRLQTEDTDEEPPALDVLLKRLNLTRDVLKDIKSKSSLNYL